MAKLLLLSVMIAMIALPAIAARSKSGPKGIRRTILSLALFNLFYVFALRFLFWRLGD
jgi:Kef-type K+ transport system membrane component KefB